MEGNKVYYDQMRNVIGLYIKGINSWVMISVYGQELVDLEKDHWELIGQL